MNNAAMRPIRVFLAVPGTDLGSDAIWKNPKDVRNFFSKVARRLEEHLSERRDHLSRPVQLVVEKEKHKAGVIHDSMFNEAYTADVFIADLTGHNPNVFFELGVRYSLRRNITIPVSQSTSRLPFNIEHMRAVQYANRPDDVAIEELIKLIEEGLVEDENDSPIMSVLDLAVVPRNRWESVSGERRDALLRAAEQLGSEHFVRKVELLRDAVDADPNAVKPRALLLKVLRTNGSYTEALTAAAEGLELDPSQAIFHQERGLSLGRLDRPEEAAEALRQAAKLNPNSSEILSNFGGALRRLGLRKAPSTYDQEVLREALEAYERAAKINRYNTYPGLNIVRLRLLLSRFRPEEEDLAQEQLRSLHHLCAFEAAENPDDCWRQFDLADTQLLLGRVDAGLKTYKGAISMIPSGERANVLGSPQSALRELLEAKVLGESVAQGAADIVELLEHSIE